jgi:hypothetical protein
MTGRRTYSIKDSGTDTGGHHDRQQDKKQGKTVGQI